MPLLCPLAWPSGALAVIELAEPVGAKGDGDVISDATCAAYLAYSAVECALVDVNIDLKCVEERDVVAEWTQKVADLLAHADATYASTRAAIQPPLRSCPVTAQLLDGKALSKTIRDDLKQQFAAFTAEHGAAPGLAVLRVGDDEASAGYARRRSTRPARVSAPRTVPSNCPASVQQADVAAAIAELNADGAVHGIMILEPLPRTSTIRRSST